MEALINRKHHIIEMPAHLQGAYANTPRDCCDIPQEDLNITNKLRSNPLPWTGQFSPQLIEVLLSRYALSSSHILDPFVGSGTTLFEAGKCVLRATGIELNPAATMLAQTYEFINLTQEEREESIKAVSRALNGRKEFIGPLLSSGPYGSDSKTVKEVLVEIYDTFSRNCYPRQLMATLIILLDFHKPDLSTGKVLKEWYKLKKLIRELPFSSSEIRVHQADARRLPLEDDTVDFVITSPPYINVFNYHQKYRASVEALTHGILRVAQSEIGSNRKHRGNRYLTVIQYCLDMSLVFTEILRVCKPDSHIIFVVGRESSVKKTRFFNGEIIAELAVRALGMELILRQERVFMNRFGQKIFEDILHLSSSNYMKNEGVILNIARDIAKQVLQAARDAAPDESKLDLEDALHKLPTVRPSRYFSLELLNGIPETKEMAI